MADRCDWTGARNPVPLRAQQHHRSGARRRDATLTLISLYIVYEAMRLGLPRAKLLRMLRNVGVEAALGTVPLLGDLFDVVWKANLRNVDIIDEHFGMLPNRR